MIKHLFGKKFPKILSTGIQFADGDHLEPQDHEKEGGEGGGGESDAGKESKVDPDKKAAFFQKYSASKNAPPELGGSVSNEPNRTRIEAAKSDAAKQEEQNRIQREQGEKKKAGSNLPKILDEKRTAEKERDEFKQKAEEFEKTIKPEYDKKIADLEAKIASGDFSATKEKEFQDRINSLEKEKQEKEETLVNENKQLKNRLRFYDLQNDEEFNREYVRPIEEAHKVAAEAIGGDQAKMGAFHRALLANQSFLRATSEEEKRRAMADRNAILSSIVEGMDEYTADTFKRSTQDYIRLAARHADALKDHEKTSGELREKAKRVQETQQASVLEAWSKAYKTTGESFKDDETLSEEQLKLAKELGFDVKSEMDQANVLAQKVVTGQSSMMDAVKMVHQGRVYVAMRARNKALEKQLADRDALIAKLRKSGTGGGESNGSGQQEQKPDKPTRADLHRKYSANRAGIRA